MNRNSRTQRSMPSRLNAVGETKWIGVRLVRKKPRMSATPCRGSDIEYLLDVLGGREDGAVGASGARDLKRERKAFVAEPHRDRARRKAREIGVIEERPPVVV